MYKLKSFTMVEMLISMLILIILSSLANQAYHYLFSQQALVASTKRLYLFLELAKSHSMKYNDKIYVHFCQLASSKEWRMAQSDQASCDCFVANSCLVNGRSFNQSLSDGKLVLIASSDITFSGQQASYNAMRFAVNSGSVTLNDSRGNRLKVIQSAMRLRICSPDSAQFGYKKC